MPFARLFETISKEVAPEVMKLVNVHFDLFRVSNSPALLLDVYNNFSMTNTAIYLLMFIIISLLILPLVGIHPEQGDQSGWFY